VKPADLREAKALLTAA